MQEFTLTLSAAEVNLIGALLVKQPYEQVAPLIAKLNSQLNEQQPRPAADEAAAPKPGEPTC